MEASQQTAGDGDGNGNTTCPADNNDNRRGIRNISRVSCHVACAIQILCHAIPTVRSTLNALAAYQENSKDNHLLDVCRSSSDILLEELLDFVRLTKRCDTDDSDEINHGDSCNEEHGNRPWNPQRLYDYLDKVSVNGLTINPHDVGDASRTLSCLLHLLSHDDACCGPAWKNLLDASIWEGETRQILEGRQLLEQKDDVCRPTEPSPQGTDSKLKIFERRFLQRIKPAAKNKPMLSPLVLKFSPKQRSAAVSTTTGSDESMSSKTWSIVEALDEIVKPQQIQGSSYPWESISPDTYSEQEILCRPYQEDIDSDGNSSSEDERQSESDSSIQDSESGDDTISDDESESESESENGSESESESDSDSDSDSDSENDLDENNWMTFKRQEIRKIPRIWMLHLDRPRISMNRFRSSLSSEDRIGNISLFDHVQVMLDLDTSSVMTPMMVSTNDCDISSYKRCDGDIREHNSSTDLSLRGAIIQVVELDDSDEKEEDWEGGHSITLLRNNNTDEAESWLLIDDDKTQTITETRAIQMMGGVLERDCCAGKGSIESDETHGWIYYAASLLVYSISVDETKVKGTQQWKTLEKNVVCSWEEHKTQLAATVKLQKSYVGKRIKVKWAKEKFYAGTITEYDISTGKHQVNYDDGDVKHYNLAQKTIEWID